MYGSKFSLLRLGRICVVLTNKAGWPVLAAILMSSFVLHGEAKNDQGKASLTQIPLPSLAAEERPDKLLSDEKGTIYLVTSHYKKDKASQPHREKISIYEFVNKTFKRITEYSYKDPFDYDIKVGGGRISLLLLEPCNGCVGELNLIDLLYYQGMRWENITKGCVDEGGDRNFGAYPIFYVDHEGSIIVIQQATGKSKERLCKYTAKWEKSIINPSCYLSFEEEYILSYDNKNNKLAVWCHPEEYIVKKYGEKALMTDITLKTYWLYLESKGNWEVAAKTENMRIKTSFEKLTYSGNRYYLTYLEEDNTCPQLKCRFRVNMFDNGEIKKLSIPQEIDVPLHYLSSISAYNGGIILYAIKNNKKDDNLYLYSYDGNAWTKKTAVPDVSREDKLDVIVANNSDIIMFFMDKSKKQYVAYLIK